ncbi:hypothetical protein [Microbacterium sp. 18062]|uniref:hypothetical protein n=1 Tax=Microbacterium sp. 18062 TaxID=2681410 RepID=UPI001358C533|nr:hypothetical protein [Microbacterium sp. 18062]
MNERMPHGTAIEDALVARMHADLTRLPWYKRWYGRVGIVGAGALVVAGGVAATTLLTAEPVTDSFTVHCLSEASLNPDGSLPGTTVGLASPDGVLPIDDAIDMCTLAWESGAMDRTDPLDPSPAPGVAPDDFTLCITDLGEAAVVPGEVACSSLRLHPFSSE